jgi:hypothetical protein
MRLPEPIGNDLRRELGRFGIVGEMAAVVAAWPAAVGQAVAANAWPARIARDGTLHVATRSSAWAFELTQLSAPVLDRLRQVLGEGCPEALRFAVGPLPESGAESETIPIRTVPKPSAAQAAEGARLAADIEDSRLRRTVGRAIAASLAAAEANPADRSV